MLMSGTKSTSPSFNQRRHAAEGGRQTLAVVVPPDHWVWRMMGVDQGGIIRVGYGEEQECEIQLGVEFNEELAFDHPTDGEYRLRVRGRNLIEVYRPDGAREILTYEFRTNTCRVVRQFRDVVRVHVGERSVSLTSDGGVWDGGQRRDAKDNWTASFGSTTVICSSCVVSWCCGDELLYFDRQLGRWFQSVCEATAWAFGEILNGENSLSVSLFGGLVTVYANGCFTLADTYSYAPQSHIDQALLGDGGECALYVARSAGSDDIYLYEQNASDPTGVLRYVPDYFIGKDGESQYPAWLYAASDMAVPPGQAGTSFFGTLFAILLLLLLLMSLVLVPAAVAAAVVVSLLAVSSMVGGLIRNIRDALGV
ncbi:hypothetical protein [Aeoliella sp.]|uniref:hypothetical protein n=1 Tax=Aeoliella sp. TaxID=2795800 RepID=UPI003CCC0930